MTTSNNELKLKQLKFIQAGLKKLSVSTLFLSRDKRSFSLSLWRFFLRWQKLLRIKLSLKLGRWLLSWKNSLRNGFLKGWLHLLNSRYHLYQSEAKRPLEAGPNLRKMWLFEKDKLKLRQNKKLLELPKPNRNVLKLKSVWKKSRLSQSLILLKLKKCAGKKKQKMKLHVLLVRQLKKLLWRIWNLLDQMISLKILKTKAMTITAKNHSEYPE